MFPQSEKMSNFFQSRKENNSGGLTGNFFILDFLMVPNPLAEKPYSRNPQANLPG
jgi:hypothetical protein